MKRLIFITVLIVLCLPVLGNTQFREMVKRFDSLTCKPSYLAGGKLDTVSYNVDITELKWFHAPKDWNYNYGFSDTTAVYDSDSVYSYLFYRFSYDTSGSGLSSNGSYPRIVIDHAGVTKWYTHTSNALGYYGRVDSVDTYTITDTLTEPTVIHDGYIRITKPFEEYQFRIRKTAGDTANHNYSKITNFVLVVYGLYDWYYHIHGSR